MSKLTYERIRANPKFQELVAKRTKMSWLFAAVVLGAYYSFIALVAFAPQVLHVPLGSGRTTWGVIAGVSIVLLCWLLTALYVRRANTEFDAINNEILRESL
ncbi:MAG TPA: DUF485 domain-containing protein [Magnetospirillum sp.]|jgi:uncharacterized membrane protein (DUF485 family)|nr:DUF485 domain-containing protein [Magnetospirillum sp.]